MQIEKINENQLEVTLNLEDLRENNISIHSFMCNSAESKNLFFNILNFADEKIGFSIKNCEVIIEAFSFPIKSSFLLLFTRVSKPTYLHPSKTQFKVLNFNKTFWIEFNNLEEFCAFCKIFKDASNIKTSLYLLNNHYFLHIEANNLKNYFKLLTCAYEFSSYVYGHDFILDENAEIIARDFAVQTAKKYFI